MRGDKAFRRTFGRALKARREAAGLTQRELAEAVDIAEKYLSRIEMGIATPSLPVAARLARELASGLDALLGLTGADEPPEALEIAKLLRGRSPADRRRAVRIVVELFR
jgi:transcriptional regulator with XRE-family HTH domain